MVDLCECDVKEKEKLALFRLKRSEWKGCLIEDKFSISNQITNMLWNDTIFRTFDEARKLTKKRNTNNLGFNRPLLGLLDQSYATTQVMAIRRLTDPTLHDPNKAIISLPRLIDDMKQNSDLITRENYICYEGTAFRGASDEEDPINQMHWDRKQKYFDKLSNVPANKRSRTDKIGDKIFKSLSKELTACKDLRTYANKFVAHASDPQNRTKLTEKEKNITRQNLDDAYKAIIRVSSYMGAIILYEHSLGQVPIPQFNQTENLDKPMVTKEDLSNLKSYWRQRSKEVVSWGSSLLTMF